MIRVLIADDEALARTNLREALRPHPGFQVVGDVNSGTKVLDAVATLEPDLVLLDIQMPGRDGVDVARELATLPKCPAVIFVTAYSEHAVDAFELCALDYLLKPFDDERFAEALRRAERTVLEDSRPLLRELGERLSASAAPPERLLMRSVGSIRVVAMADVLWFAAGGNYVEVHHRDGVDLHRVSLGALERVVSSREFIRVHRSALVRLGEVREVKQTGPEQSVAVMSNGDAVRVSQNHRDTLLRRLEGDEG
ncbi:MAG: LytTR family DNA-binding domain-containing protein [Myxococcota bacterium]